jgi:hypothetical protein
LASAKPLLTVRMSAMISRFLLETSIFALPPGGLDHLVGARRPADAAVAGDWLPFFISAS